MHLNLWSGVSSGPSILARHSCQEAYTINPPLWGSMGPIFPKVKNRELRKGEGRGGEGLDFQKIEIPVSCFMCF